MARFKNITRVMQQFEPPSRRYPPQWECELRVQPGEEFEAVDADMEYFQMFTKIKKPILEKLD